MATSAAAAVAIAQRRVLSHFFAANAVTPESATMFASDRRLHQRQFERFVAKGVIKEARPGLYYVDVPAWNAWHTGVHTRLKLVLLVMLAVLAAVLLLTVGKS